MKKKILIAIILFALILLILFLAQSIELVDNNLVNLPIVGQVNLKDASIPVAAVILGIIDGFNPCAMWVLILLITMLIGMKNKKRMWLLGSAFLLVTAILYFFVLMAWVSFAGVFASNSWILSAIAAVAIVGGAFNLKKYFNTPADGCEVVDDQKRFKIIDKVKQITTEKSFLLSLVGVILLAISVNLIEVACSAVLPAIFAGILTTNHVNLIGQIGYNLIYVFFFLLDDLLIFIFAISSFKVFGLSSKFSKYLNLIGGLIMVIMGLLLLLKPEWMSLVF